MSTILKTVILGCGNVAKAYARHLASYDNVQNLGFSDLDEARAKEFAEEFGGKVYPDLDAILADPEVDCVVNLTIHHVHEEVITKCLNGGKHVHTEKPLAMSFEAARRLVELAEAKGVRLSSAPITFLGEPAQTALKLIREDKTGPVRVIYAEVNHGRIESWHPNPLPFYDVGPLWDVGIYAVTMVTAMFGRAKQVEAHSRLLYQDRVTMNGESFRLRTPDWYTALIELESGPVVRLTCNFYAKLSKQGGMLEFHGDTGTVWMGNFQDFKAPVHFGLFADKEGMQEVAALRAVEHGGAEFGRGVQELSYAIAENRPSRASGAHAAHVIEILEAIETAARQGKPVPLTSSFPTPERMDWAR